MRQRKIRLGKTKQDNATEAYVITIPPEIALFYKDTYFTVLNMGDKITLASGTYMKDMIDVDNLSLENFKV